MEEQHGAILGPFCCVAAVCGACNVFSDAEDRAFRTHHRLLHSLEKGSGRCVVRQYVRSDPRPLQAKENKGERCVNQQCVAKGAGELSQQQTGEPKQSAEWHQLETPQHGQSPASRIIVVKRGVSGESPESRVAADKVSSRHLIGVPVPENAQHTGDSHFDCTRARKANETPNAVCAGPGKQQALTIRSSSEVSQVGDTSTKTAPELKARDTPVTVLAASDGQQVLSAGGRQEACASRRRSPHPHSAIDTQAESTKSEALLRAPVEAHACNIYRAHDCSADGKASSTEGKTGTSLNPDTACDNRATSAAVSQRCTRWKVLQRTLAVTEDHSNGSCERGRSADSVCISQTYRCNAVPRPPDVLVACVDYLLRSLLPSLIFPSSITSNVDADSSVRRIICREASAAETERSFPATTAAADINAASAAVGSGTFVDVGIARSGAAGRVSDGDAYVKYGDRRRGHEFQEPQPQHVSASTSHCPQPSHVICGNPSNVVQCGCLCHRYVLEEGQGRRSEGDISIVRDDCDQKQAHLSNEARSPGNSSAHSAYLPHSVRTGRAAVAAAAPSTPGATAAASAVSSYADGFSCVSTGAVAHLREGHAFSVAAASSISPADGPPLAAAAAAGVYSFFADRLRAVRHEAVLQHLVHRPVYFLLLLQSARYHLFADVYWAGGIFNGHTATTHSMATLPETTEGYQLSEPSDGNASSLRTVTTAPGSAQQQKSLRSSLPAERSSWHVGGRALFPSAEKAALRDGAAGGCPGTSAAAAAVTILAKVGFSASLNRMLLSSCMQQLLNFIISAAQRSSRRWSHHRQTRAEHERKNLYVDVKKGMAVGALLATRPSDGIDLGNSFSHEAVLSEERSYSGHTYSAAFCAFTSLYLQVQPNDVDEIVACALLYLLLPREDPAAPRQTVTLLVQQIASAFKSFWSECRWIRYAVDRVLLAAAGGAHRCLKELLLPPAETGKIFPFFLQCAAYSHLDFLRAAVATNIRAAAPLSPPGTRLSLYHLQQLLFCKSCGALRLAEASGCTSLQQTQQTTKQKQPAQQQQWGEKVLVQLGQSQDRAQSEESVIPPGVASSPEAALTVYFCRGLSHQAVNSTEMRSTSERPQQQQSQALAGSVPTRGSPSHNTAQTNCPVIRLFARLQSDAWQHSPPPDTLAFPRSRAELMSLFDWPTYCRLPPNRT